MNRTGDARSVRLPNSEQPSQTRPDGIAEQNWTALQEIVAAPDLSRFAELVSHFEWSTSAINAESVDQYVRDRLIEQGVAVDGSQAEQLFQRLFLFGAF